MKRKKIKLNRFLGVFCAILLVVVMVVNLVMPDVEKSEVENRSLQTFPTISMESVLDGTFGNELSDWFSDQFVGRNFLIHVRYAVLKAIGYDKIDSVYLCTDKLIEESAKPDVDNIIRNLDAIEAFAPDLPTTFMLVPNAINVQYDSLPYFTTSDGQDGIMNDIFNYFEERIETIDTRDIFAKHKEEYIYYKTDHHWTSLGAFYGCQYLLQQQGVDINKKDYTIYPVSDSFQGTLSNKTGSFGMKDQIDIYVDKNLCDYYVMDVDTEEKSRSIYSSKALDTNDQYTVFMGGNKGIVHLEMDNESDEHLLLFKDSYANAAIQFLLPYYRTITIVDARYYNEKAESLLERNQITDVLYLYNTNTFVQDTSLADVLE
ncbi:MAG: DHHW family protein [Bacillota bacterium]|nr:DHHW family protein [Bacillota bacterium]